MKELVGSNVFVSKTVPYLEFKYFSRELSQLKIFWESLNINKKITKLIF